MSLDNKKRNRLILVCNNCHRKKIKCDRKLPCSSCIKLSIDSTCFYSAPTYKREANQERTLHITENLNNDLGSVNKSDLVTTNKFLLEQVDSLKEKVKLLEENISNANTTRKDGEETQINVYKGYSISHLKYLSPSQILKKIVDSNVNHQSIGINPNCSTGFLYNFNRSLQSDPENEDMLSVHPPEPLSMITLAGSDPSSKLMLNYLSSDVVGRKHKDFFSIYLKEEGLTKEKVEMLDKKSIKFYGDRYIKRLGKTHNKLEINMAKRAISRFGFDVGITYAENDLQGLSLRQQIKSILPPLRAISLLMKHFFMYLHNSFPFLDKEVFNLDVERLLDTSFNDAYEFSLPGDINLKGGEDLATAIILLLLLRMSYLSILDCSCIVEVEPIDVDMNERAYLLKHPIPLDASYVAERCIKIFDFHSEKKIYGLQASLFIYIYRYIAPEEDLIPSDFDLNLSFGEIINQATHLLLNRDPRYTGNYFRQEPDNWKDKYFKRKFWCMLLLMDIENSIIIGCPPFTRELNCDTKFPELENQDSDSESLGQEEITFCKSIQSIQVVVASGRQIVEKIFLVGIEMELSHFLQDITDFEIIIKKHLGEMNDYLTLYDRSLKIIKLTKFRAYLYYKFLLSYIYYSLFLFLERKGEQELSIFYLKKIYGTVLFELAGITTGFFENCETFFGPSSLMVLKPILLIFNRFQMLCSSFRVRIRCTLIFKEKNNGIEDILNSITKRLVFIEEEGARFVYKASKQNFYAWWYCKGYRFGQSMILDELFYTLNESDSKKAVFDYPRGEFNSLNNLLKCIEDKIISIREYYLKLSLSIHKNEKYSPVMCTREEHENELMERVQIDKMWQSLKYIKTDNKEKQFRKDIHGNQDEGMWLTDNIIPSESSSGDELWKGDFDVLKNFMTDDLFFSNY